jgi:uncharacterized membrane protein
VGPARILARLRSWRLAASGVADDQRGNVIIMTAFFGVAACAALALAVDYGSIYYEKRRSQSAVDLAALAGAQAPQAAQVQVTDSLSRNAYSSREQLSVETGVYTADLAVPVANRFVAGAAPANAVRVDMTTRTPLYFGAAITGRDSVLLRSRAVAVNAQMTQFSIGSRLVGVQDGIANSLLSRITGSTVSLSAMDYNALAGASVDMFQFSKALATRLNMQGVTFNQLANASMTVGDAYSALSVLSREGSYSDPIPTALEQLANLSGAGSLALDLGKVVDFGPFGNQPVSDSPAVGANVGLMDLVTTAAMIANGTRQNQLDLGATILGLSSVTAYLAMGERTVQSPWLSLGDTDVVVRTAQTRLYVDAKVGGSGVLSGASVALPLYVELASGQARLDSLSCSRDGVANTQVALAVLPGLAELWLGTLNTGSLTTFTQTPTVSDAQIVSLPLVSVTGSGYVRGSTPSEQVVTFSYDDIQQLTAKSVSSSGISGSLVGSLLNNLSLNVSVGGLLSLGASSVTSALSSVLADALSPLDSFVDSLLSLAGVRLGQADVIVNGLRCDGSALVQ